MAHKKALIVGVEGLPGCGKTTAIRLIVAALRVAGLWAVAADIDTSAHAAALRAIANTLPLGDRMRSMLFWTMRGFQYRVIEEMRSSVDIIFADRTWGTALALDGYGHGVPTDILAWFGQNLVPPDITFLFQASLDVARARKESQTMRDLAFARRVEQGYQELARAYSWISVDATQTPETVSECCLAVIRKALAHQKKCAS